MGRSPRQRLERVPPPQAERTPPTPAGGPTLLLAWVAPGSRQCEHTIIHYNSITVIKAGGMQEAGGSVANRIYTPCHQREITAADAAARPPPAICSARGPPEGQVLGGPRGGAAQGCCRAASRAGAATAP